MVLLKFLCFLLSALFFFMPVAQAATLADAQSVFMAGRYQEAYDMFFTLLREDPSDDGVNLGLARAALAAKRPHQAIMAYERLIAKYPGETGLYHEVAQAYLAVGDKATAQRYLQNDQSLNPSGLNIMMNKLGARYQRWQLSSKIRIGALYDSNANQGLKSNNINIGGWRVDLTDAEKIGTGGVYLGGQLNWAWRQKRDGDRWTVGDFQFYTRYGFNNDLRGLRNEFSQWYRAAVGMRYMKPASFFDVRLKTELFDYDFTRTVHSIGPEATYVKALNPRWQLISSGSFDWRDYKYDSNYSGNSYSLGQYARLFFGKDKHEFVFGGRYTGADTNFKRFSYNGFEVSSSFRFKLKHGLSLSPTLSYVREKYQGPATILDTANRLDKRLRLGVGVTYQVSEVLSLEAGYNYIRNMSNSELNKYDRHIVNLGCVYSF